jgi:predicted ribosomally synthesized peptide with nif11-like leader
MAVDDAKRFLDALLVDADLRARIADAAHGDERVAIATEAGFEFSPDDFEAACEEYERAAELDPEEAETLGFASFSILGSLRTGSVPPYGPGIFYQPRPLTREEFKPTLPPKT